MIAGARPGLRLNGNGETRSSAEFGTRSADLSSEALAKEERTATARFLRSLRSVGMTGESRRTQLVGKTHGRRVFKEAPGHGWARTRLA